MIVTVELSQRTASQVYNSICFFEEKLDLCFRIMFENSVNESCLMHV